MKRILPLLLVIGFAIGLAVPAFSRNRLQDLETLTGNAILAVGASGFVAITGGSDGDVLTLNSASSGGAHWVTPAAVSACGAYPVGSIYIGTSSTNPATTLGCGTWSAFGTGQVPVGFSSGDANFNTDEKTGGADAVAAAGTISTPTFSGAALATHSHGVGTLAATGTAVANHSYTPAGTNSAPLFIGSALAGIPYTPAGIVAAPTFTGNALAGVAYTPAGTNSVPTFTGSALATHSHELPIQLVSATSARLLASATFGTGTSRAAAGAITPTAASTSAAVALTQAVSAGTPAGTVTAPTFTGNAATINPGTPTGTNSAPAFTGTLATINPGTPAGVVGAPTFAGTLASLTHSVTDPTVSGSTAAVSAGTPSGTVSTPAFTGTATSVLQPYIVVRMWKRTA